MTDFSFSAVTRMLRATALIEERFSAGLSAIHGLSLRETLLLLHVQAAPGGRLSRVDLAKRLHVSPSTATRMAKPLEKIGVVGREPDPRDARLAYVVLTEAGETLLNDAKATLQRQCADLFKDRWEEDHIGALSALVGRLTTHLPGDLG